MSQAIIIAISVILASVLGALINGLFGKKKREELKCVVDENLKRTDKIDETTINISETDTLINNNTKSIKENVGRLIDDLNFRKGEENNKIQLNDVFKVVQNIYEDNANIKNEIIELKKELKFEKEKNIELSRKIEEYEQKYEEEREY